MNTSRPQTWNRRSISAYYNEPYAKIVQKILEQYLVIRNGDEVAPKFNTKDDLIIDVLKFFPQGRSGKPLNLQTCYYIFNHGWNYLKDHLDDKWHSYGLIKSATSLCRDYNEHAIIIKWKKSYTIPNALDEISDSAVRVKSKKDSSTKGKYNDSVLLKLEQWIEDSDKSSDSIYHLPYGSCELDDSLKSAIRGMLEGLDGYIVEVLETRELKIRYWICIRN